MSNLELSFVRTEAGLVPTIGGGRAAISCPTPVVADFLGQGLVEVAYRDARASGSSYLASASVTGARGTVVDVTDVWRPSGDRIRVDRKVSVKEAGACPGVRVELRAGVAIGGDSGELQFFIPGSLYNRNDTDGDGVEDYLGTFEQDFRDDRLGSMTVLAYSPANGTYAAISRVSAPRLDETVSQEQIMQRFFVQRTEIGSLGLRPSSMGPAQVELRASYPFSEERSFCINTKGDGWAAYLPAQEGLGFAVSYEIHVAGAASLTDAIWDITTRQMRSLQSQPSRLGFTFEEALDARLTMSQHFYREWTAEEDPREPAGYMVHFSPRVGRTNGALLEYGFTGNQALVAQTSLRFGRERGVPLYVARARRVIDFFVNNFQEENGYTRAMYDVAKHDFVTWFTGILLPFQYSATKDELRSYVGSQVADTLWPVGEALRAIDGNYTRTMCDAWGPVLRAYRDELDHGVGHPEWLAGARRFGDFLLRIQGEDGSWHRGYDLNGQELTHPVEWFGASDLERKSGTIFGAPVLIDLFRLTRDVRYLEAAHRAARFIADTYVDSVDYLGGLNDTTHVKSVKGDAIGVMFAMRSLLWVYEETGDEALRCAAVKAAKALASWVYLWNVPMPEGTTLGEGGFRSTGWAVCDVIPGGSYLDDEFLEFIGDYVRIAELDGNERLFDVAELVENGMHDALSMPGNMFGYVMPGIQCEGIMTAYWLSEPDVTRFSGAVNKTKGDDNDTCNGLTNAQAAHGMYDLLDRYGTLDFNRIRRLLFAAQP